MLSAERSINRQRVGGGASGDAVAAGAVNLDCKQCLTSYATSNRLPSRTEAAETAVHIIRSQVASRPIVRDRVAWSVRRSVRHNREPCKATEPTRCRLGCGLEWARGNMYWTGVLTGATLANTTEPSMCGGDAALCQITCFRFFSSVHIGLRPDSRILKGISYTRNKRASSPAKNEQRTQSTEVILSFRRCT